MPAVAPIWSRVALMLTLTLLGGAVPARLFGQNATLGEAPLHFQRFDQRDGLSHSTIHALLQDRQGFVWIGTADGLNRYDGYGFTVYRHDPTDDTSLPENTVQALLEDSTGLLWIGTAGGLSRFNPVTGRAGRLSPPGLDVSALTRGPDGTLWLNTYNRGPHLLDPASGKLQAVEEPSASCGFPGAHHVTFAKRLDESPWRTGSVRNGACGLHRFDPLRGRFVPTPAPEAAWASFYAAPSGTIWLTVASGEPERLQAPFRSIPRLPAGEPTGRFLEDRSGMLWIGSDRGVYRYDPRSGALHLHPLDASETAALGNYVLALFEDRAGAVWIGTRSGLYRFDPHRKPFGHLATGEATPIMAILKSEEGGLWTGTLGGGLLRLDPSGAVVERYTARQSRLVSDHVWALLQDSSHPRRLWIGTDGGLCTLDRPSNRITCQPLPADGRGGTYVYTLARDGAGGLWAGGGRWIYRLDAATAEVRQRIPLDAIPRLSTVQSLHVGRSGVLWIGTEKRGLWTYGPATGRLTPVAPDTLGSATVWSIHEDALGALWIGTPTGLARFDPATGVLARFHDPERRAGDLVYSIVGDEAGQLWLGTGRGLARFDPASGQFRTYDGSDGVRNLEFNRRAAFRSPGGVLYFGGLDGITAFRPGSIRDNPIAPPVVLTRVHGTRREGSFTRNPAEAGPEGLAFSHRDHTLLFEFVALGFTAPDKNRYRYRLEGFDRGWVEAGTNRQARYTNVPPGTYTFRVRAANNDGHWNESGAALRLTVAPPYWRTPWFRLLVIGLAAGLLAAAYRYRVAKLLEVERIRLRIAADLHDDIGSKLASIALLSEMVAGRARLEERERRQLGEVTRAARRMAGDLRDIVWLVRPGHDTLGDLAGKMEHIAASLLDGTSYSFHTSASASSVSLDMERRRHIFLFFREALHNVANHARASHVEIRVEEQHGILLLEVCDDGVGFDPATPHEGLGLPSLHERARLLGGTLVIESAPGAGTTLRLCVRMA